MMLNALGGWAVEPSPSREYNFYYKQFLLTLSLLSEAEEPV